MHDVLNDCGYHVDNCDVRMFASNSPLLEGTKFVILFGEQALTAFTRKHELNNHRGHVTALGNGVLCVATWNPLDCHDTFQVEADEDADEEDDLSSGKDAGPTARANYPFWFKRDVTKLLTGRWTQFPPKQLSVMNMATIRDWEKLSSTSDSLIYFDIETHPLTNTLQCFSCAIDDGPVVTELVYDHRGHRYTTVNHLAILAKAFQRNTVVIHNAMFDLPFMCLEHHMPFGRRIHDTMAMHHRAWPEAEKSLHHAISHLTNSPFHKDGASTFNPRNWAQVQSLLLYNAKDVETLRAIYKALVHHATTIPGLQASYDAVNDSLYPYILAGLLGFDVSCARQQAHQRKLLNKVVQYKRILKILVGYELNPSSPKQCMNYFHTEQMFAVVKTTKKTSPTSDSGPSLAGDALYMLKVKHPNCVTIDVILAIRDCEKQIAQLQFKAIPWETKR